MFSFMCSNLKQISVFEFSSDFLQFFSIRNDRTADIRKSSTLRMTAVKVPTVCPVSC